MGWREDLSQAGTLSTDLAVADEFLVVDDSVSTSANLKGISVTNLLVEQNTTGVAFLNEVITIGNTTAYTVLAANSGKLHTWPDVTTNIVITLPAAVDGMRYKFVYVGIAADAEDMQLIAQAGDFMIGGIVFQDTAATDFSMENPDGSTHIALDLVNNDLGTWVEAISDGTFWHIKGIATGTGTNPAFATS